MSAVCRLQRVAFKASEKNRGKVAPNICLGVSSCWWKAEWTGNRSEGDTHHPHYRERVKHEFDDNTQAFPSEPVCVEHPMSRNLGGGLGCTKERSFGMPLAVDQVLRVMKWFCKTSQNQVKDHRSRLRVRSP